MRMRRWVLVAVAALAAAGCGGDEPARPGTLLVRLGGTTPARAVRFRLTGPGMAVQEPGTGAVIAAVPAGTDTLIVAAFAPVGATLNGGAVAAVSVPDTRAVSSYTVTVIEAAGPGYALLPASSVGLTVLPQ